MKNLFPFFAACLLLAGSACSTYSANTDPNDLGSGTELKEEVTTTVTETKPASAEVAAPTAAKADTTAAPAQEAAAPAAH